MYSIKHVIVTHTYRRTVLTGWKPSNLALHNFLSRCYTLEALSPHPPLTRQPLYHPRVPSIISLSQSLASNQPLTHSSKHYLCTRLLQSPNQHSRCHLVPLHLHWRLRQVPPNYQKTTWNPRIFPHLPWLTQQPLYHSVCPSIMGALLH